VRSSPGTEEAPAFFLGASLGAALRTGAALRAGGAFLAIGLGAAFFQGLTLVHSSAHSERFVLDRGCTLGLCSPVLRGCVGCVGCALVSDTAQVELRSGRV